MNEVVSVEVPFLLAQRAFLFVFSSTTFSSRWSSRKAIEESWAGDMFYCQPLYG